MKKICKLFAVFLFAGLSVISCKNNFSDFENEIKNTNEKAYLSFGINENEERMVAPAPLTWAEVHSIELKKDDSSLKTWTVSAEASAYEEMKADTSVVLDAGTYNFTVLLKDADSNILQTGTLENVEIKAGNNPLNFKTKTCMEGTGRLSVNFDIKNAGGVQKIEVFLDNKQDADITIEANPEVPFESCLEFSRSINFACGNYLIQIKINNKTVLTDFIEIQNKRETVYNYYENEKPTLYPVKFLLDDGTDANLVEFGEGVTIDTYTTGGDLPDPSRITNIPDGYAFWGWTCNGKKITKLPENTDGQVVVYARYGTSVTNAEDLHNSFQNGVRSFKITPETQSDWDTMYESIAKQDSLTVILDLTNVSFTDNKIGETYFTNDFKPTITELVIPASVEQIENYSFYELDQLESVTFAEGSELTSLGGSAFSGCTSLQEIVIPKGAKNVKIAFKQSHLRRFDEVTGEYVPMNVYIYQNKIYHA